MDSQKEQEMSSEHETHTREEQNVYNNDDGALAVAQASEELKKDEGTAVDKTRRFLYALFKIWCAFPTFAYEMNLRSGSSESFAETAYVTSMTCDSFSPGPLVSIFFCLVATIRKPSSLVETFSAFKDFLVKTAQGEKVSFSARDQKHISEQQNEEAKEQAEILGSMQRLFQLNQKIKTEDNDGKMKLEEEQKKVLESIQGYLQQYSDESMDLFNKSDDSIKKGIEHQNIQKETTDEKGEQRKEHDTSLNDLTEQTKKDNGLATEVKENAKKEPEDDDDRVFLGFRQVQGQHIPIPLV